MKVIASAFSHTAETDGVHMLVVGLGHGTVIEGQLLAIFDRSEGVHAYEVPSLGDSDDRTAVGLAGV